MSNRRGAIVVPLRAYSVPTNIGPRRDRYSPLLLLSVCLVPSTMGDNAGLSKLSKSLLLAANPRAGPRRFLLDNLPPCSPLCDAHRRGPGSVRNMAGAAHQLPSSCLALLRVLTVGS